MMDTAGRRAVARIQETLAATEVCDAGGGVLHLHAQVQEAVMPQVFITGVTSTRLGTGLVFIEVHSFQTTGVRAPEHAEHSFRFMSNTDSGACRTAIPAHAEHRFR